MQQTVFTMNTVLLPAYKILAIFILLRVPFSTLCMRDTINVKNVGQKQRRLRRTCLRPADHQLPVHPPKFRASAFLLKAQRILLFGSDFSPSACDRFINNYSPSYQKDEGCVDLPTVCKNLRYWQQFMLRE